MLTLELLRRLYGLPQSAVGARNKIPQERISQYERGLRPTEAHMRALAAFFGLPNNPEMLFAHAPESIVGIVLEHIESNTVPPPPDMKPLFIAARETKVRR